MIKSFDEMRKIDVTPYLDKRDKKFDYLNWAKCKTLLHNNGASKVWFEPMTNANGSSLFMSDQVFTDGNGNTNRCYEVRIKIVIDELEFEAQYPVMNGSNPVKDNSMSQQRVWNAQTRAFVKGVAMMTGLGFDLWAGDEDSAAEEENLNDHNIWKIKERFQQEYTTLIKRGMSTGDIASALNKSEDEVKTIFTYFEQLDRFEKQMKEL